MVELLIILICNFMYITNNNDYSGRIYRVEAARVVDELQDKTLAEIDLAKYETIVKVSEFNPEKKCNNDYVVEDINGKLYRIEYIQSKYNQIKNNNNKYNYIENRNGLVYMNSALIIMFLFTSIILFYIGQKILKPFHNMSKLSYELARGNLSVPIKEEKSKFFGRFLWGMDMLRENLENNKEKELELQKEKKTLILSLSHDIKTPLAAIELYSKALSENLYDSEEKRNESIQGISNNVKIIEKYINEIVIASREDFLNLEVNLGEVYLSEIVNSIQVYYREKLSVIHTEFVVEETTNCLLKGDKDRIIEVLQNIIENAIKYGDGKLIRLFCDEEEDCKLIYVENTGCNLKKEELPHLFDSFYRSSNSQKVKGSGLGLYICKNLMRKMDGDIFTQIDGAFFRAAVVIRKV